MPRKTASKSDHVVFKLQAFLPKILK